MPLPAPAPQPPAGYLDAVGGQPLLPAARSAWGQAADAAWADPARLHPEGRRAGALLDAARASIAAHLGVGTESVYFTSSGPTAVALAVRGLAARPAAARGPILLSAVESMAVREPAGVMTGQARIVAVDNLGRVDLEDWTASVSAGASLACLQAANPEVGTRQPLAEASDACRAAGVPLLVHAVQVLGRDHVPADWDVLAASARDWGGPAGVGVLAVRPEVSWRPDASPDRGWVGGFPDIPGAVAAAAAWEYLAPAVEDEAARARDAIALLRTALPESVRGLEPVGDPDDRLPHVLTMTIDAIVGEQLVHELARRGISAASGSACTADARMPSTVLEAMGLADRSSLRVSLPLGFAAESVDLLMTHLPPAIAECRK